MTIFLAVAVRGDIVCKAFYVSDVFYVKSEYFLALSADEMLNINILFTEYQLSTVIYLESHRCKLYV